jgi:WD40 repeat protein
MKYNVILVVMVAMGNGAGSTWAGDINCPHVIFSRILPDKKGCLVISTDKSVRVLSPDCKLILREFAVTSLGSKGAVDLSHDGQFLAVAEDSGIAIWGVGSGKKTGRVSFRGDRLVSYVAFSRSGKYLAVVQSYPQTISSIVLPELVIIYDVASGKEQVCGLVGPSVVHISFFSNDEKLLVSSSSRFSLFDIGDSFLKKHW